MDLITILLSVVILALVVLSCILYFSWYKTNQRINVLLEKGKIKDFKEVLLSQKEKNEALEVKLQSAIGRIKELETISKRTIQKVGVVRFNPFNDMGGNQSFVVALLDDRNNGFVLSSLFVQEGNRVFAKAIKNGKSDFLLSKEELDAIDRAMKS